MALSAVPVTWNDLIYVDGDSTADRANYWRLLDPVFLEIASVFRRSGPSGAQRAPIVSSIAASGATTTTLVGNLAGIALKHATKCIFMIGINDVLTAVAPATSHSNMVAILNASAGAGVPTLVIGPLCSREKWPTGQNVNDTLITNLDADFAATCAGYANAAYLSLRTAVYAVVEPLLNLPAPGVDGGPLTKADPSFVHGNSLARRYYRDAILAKLSLST